MISWRTQKITAPSTHMQFIDLNNSYWVASVESQACEYEIKKIKTMKTNNNSETEVETIDVAQFTKEGKNVPPGKQYKIMVDRQNFTVKQECMSGKEILNLAGKTPPERFQLNQRYIGGKVVKVGYDQTVCFTEPGIEKFMTIPLDQTEG